MAEQLSASVLPMPQHEGVKAKSPPPPPASPSVNAENAASVPPQDTLPEISIPVIYGTPKEPAPLSTPVPVSRENSAPHKDEHKLEIAVAPSIEIETGPKQATEEDSPMRKLQHELSKQKALLRAERDRLKEEREKLKVDQDELFSRVQDARSVMYAEIRAEVRAEHEKFLTDREQFLAERELFLAEQEAQKAQLAKDKEEVTKAQTEAKSMWDRAESVFACQGEDNNLSRGAREMWNRAEATRVEVEGKIRILEEKELLAQLREERIKKEAEMREHAEQRAKEDREANEQKAKEIREHLEASKIDLTFSARHLPTRDVISKSDPFLVVLLQDPTDLTFSELGRTEPILDNEDPVWTKSIGLSLDPKNRDPVLRFLIFDQDSSDASLSKHDFIGETFLKLSTIFSYADEKKGIALKIHNVPVTKGKQTSLLFITPKENEFHSQDKKKQVARKKVAEEIVSTERSYLSGLFAMGTHFGTPAQALLSREDYDTLFGASSMLAAVNKAFFEDVETRVAHWDDLHTTIGDLFVTFAPYFKLYTSYVNGFAKAELLTKTLFIRNKNFKALCEKGTEASGNTLQSFLILPIQRIPRYVLLLNELLKNTQDTHPDYQKITEAVPHVKSVAAFVNKAMSGAGLAEELLAIQHSFGPSCPDLLAPGRSLVHRALLTRVDLTKGARLKKYDFLLMSDIILFAKPSSALISDDLRKLSGLITIDDHFFVQDIDFAVDLEGHQEFKEAKEPHPHPHHHHHKGDPEPSPRQFFTKSKSHLNLLGRPAFRIISHKAVSVWVAESPEDKVKWLEMFQKVASARMKGIEFKNRTGDMLYDGLTCNRVQRDLEPQPSTLLFLRHEKDGGQGWIHARVWYEERAQLVHVMLVEARDLPAADVNGFSDPYVTLSYYSLVELEALSYHQMTHRAGRSALSLGSQKSAAMMAELPKDVQKLKPRWKTKSKVVKKNLNPWWGQHFTFTMSSAERISRNKNLLVLEVYDWDQIGSDDFLGQCSFDLAYVPAFANAASAPSTYTKMPEARSKEADFDHGTTPTMLKRWSLVQSKRNLDPTGPQEDSTFFNLLHTQIGLGGVKGRFFWLNKGSILLQKAQSFSTSDLLSIETGSVPSHLQSPVPLSERACYLLITTEEEGEERSPTGHLKHHGKFVLNLQAESATAVREWCCQLTQVLPMIRVADKAGTLIRQSARQIISTASEIISVACDHFEKHLFRKRDLCRTCGLTRDEHAPEHRGKRATVSVSPSAQKAEPKQQPKSATQSMKLELPSKSEEKHR